MIILKKEEVKKFCCFFKLLINILFFVLFDILFVCIDYKRKGGEIGIGFDLVGLIIIFIWGKLRIIRILYLSL